MPAIKQNIDMVNQSVPFSSRLRESGTYLTKLDQDQSKPIPIYIEDVMPITRGYTTVTKLPAFATLSFPTSTEYDRTNIHIIYNQGNELTYLVEDYGKIWIFSQTSKTWVKLYEAIDSSIQYSVFFMKGTTHIFHREMGVWKFGLTFDDFTEVVIPALGGFNPKTTVIAMASALSYLIAVTANEVYWSDPIDETQFDPAAVGSLAGATKVLALRGSVQLVLPITDGFIIYTNVNAIAATYSQNPYNPWIFKEVANSSGAFKQTHVTYKSSLPAHFLWGDYGLMQLSPDSASVIFPELTDYLGGDTIEHFDPITMEISMKVGAELEVKLTYLNARYLALSYGEKGQVFEYILMYDMILKRWGKIKVKHKAVFNLLPPHSTGGVSFEDAELAGIVYHDWEATRFLELLARLSEANFNVGTIGILSDTNELRKIDWLAEDGRGEGVVIFGELAVNRNRLSAISEIELLGILDKNQVNVKVRSTHYNTSWQNAIYVPMYDWFVATSTGKTHEIAIMGRFQLTAVVNKLTYSGVE